LSKFISVEQNRNFEEKAKEIARQFESGMLELLSAIQRFTIESIESEIQKLKSQLIQKSVNQLRQAPSATGLENDSARAQKMKQDLSEWRTQTLPAAMKEASDHASKLIIKTKASIEKTKDKLQKATEKAQNTQMDEAILTDKKKIVKVVHEILQNKEKKKSSQSSKKKNERRLSVHQLPKKKKSSYVQRESSSSSSSLSSLNKKSRQRSDSINSSSSLSFKKINSRHRCFKCGERGHHIADCPSPKFKCFKCEKFGHLAKDCRSQVEPPQSSNRVRSNGGRDTTQRGRQSNLKVVRNPASNSRRFTRRD
jgi:hypothetical protein